MERVEGQRARGEPEWLPANGLEGAMLLALEQRDSERYAQLLMSSRLYLPVLPEPGTVAADRVAQLFRREPYHVLAFTSLGTLRWAMGEFVKQCQEVDFSRLSEIWPDSRYRLAVNPGVPIGISASIDAVTAAAAGELVLDDVDDVYRVISGAMLARTRQACLNALRGMASDDPADIATLVSHAPVNHMEQRLHDALRRHDNRTFVIALGDGELVVPTSAPVANPARIAATGFPWWIVTGATTPPVVPVFSSAIALDRLAAGHLNRVRVPTIDVLDYWPSTEYMLCFNPGASTELILPGQAMQELRSALFGRRRGSE